MNKKGGIFAYLFWIALGIAIGIFLMTALCNCGI